MSKTRRKSKRPPKVATVTDFTCKPHKSCAVDDVTRRWIRNRSDELAVKKGCRFDEERAFFVIDWIQNCCTLYEGEQAGEPMMVTDWAYDAIMRLFGWVKWSERWGRWIRRFREAWFWVPKKNKKSPTLAALGLYLTCGDGEMGQKVYFCAKDGSQARDIAGKHAIEMVLASDDMSAACTINKSLCQVTHVKTKSICKPISSHSSRNQKSKEGLNGSALIDEVHVVDGEFVGRISRAGISRSEPLMIGVSTAGDDPECFGYTCWEYGQQVEAGEVENETLLHISYSAPQDLSDEDLDRDPIKYGKMANPAWGHTVGEEEFLADYQKSKQSPVELARFKMYRLNIWQRVAAAFLKRVDWLRCLVPFQKEEQLAQPCFAAFDLSKVEDMTSLVLCFRRPEGRYRFQPYFWLPEETASADGVRDSYQKWKSEGILFTTPGRVCDYSAIAAQAADIFKAHRVQKFAYDPWQAEQFSQDIEKLTGIERFEFRQSLANFAEATSEFERLVISGKLEHDGHKILTWQAGNAKVYSDANGNKRPVKPKHDDKRKIDGIVASIMALGLAWLTESGESVYNTPDRPEGLIVL